MAEADDLAATIAATASDYRSGELPSPTAAHVQRWVAQFPEAVQVSLLRELSHVLGRTYMSEASVREFLLELITSQDVAGSDYCGFWKSANFLDIQQHGHSQEEMLALFASVMVETCGFDISECGSADGPYIYLDDALFSGSRLAQDIEAWAAEPGVPDSIDLKVIVLAAHTSADWYLEDKRLPAISQGCGKNISLEVWRQDTYENRKYYSSASQVLWPVELPDEPSVAAYANAQKFPFSPRAVGGVVSPFSSEEGRQLLERELLVAGMRIRGFSQNPGYSMRPLGFSPFGMGFGSMVVTYRNCPNNAPLALWWGDPDAAAWHPFSNWYPLFPRKTY